MIRKVFCILFCIGFLLPAGAQTSVSETKYNWSGLANSVVGDASSKRDQAYRIYRFLCDNISYDTSYSIHYADECYEQKRGVCQAYCEMFYRLGEAVGLKVDVISGKSKDLEGKIDDMGHAWVFVYTDGNAGILIDPTWGAGSVNGGVFTRSNNDDSWFDVNPYWMLFTHFPSEDQSAYQLIDNKIDFRTFAGLPSYSPFLGSFGFSGKELFEKCVSGANPQIPKAYGNHLDKVEIGRVPKDKTLRIGQSYDFIVKTKGGTRVAIFNGDRFDDQWQTQDGYTVCRFFPSEAGELSLNCNDGGKKWGTLIEYQVAQPTPADVAALEAQRPDLSPVWKKFSNFRPEQWAQHGVDIAALLAAVKQNGVEKLPAVYDKCRFSFSIADVPVSGVLRKGETYTFSFKPHEGVKTAVINGEDWYHEWAQDPSTGNMTITMSPKSAGSLKVSLQLEDGGSYWPCLEYEVR